MKKSYSVEGMMCKNCLAAVDKALNSLEGVKKAKVKLEPPVAEIKFRGDAISLEELQKAVGDYKLTEI